MEQFIDCECDLVIAIVGDPDEHNFIGPLTRTGMTAFMKELHPDVLLYTIHLIHRHDCNTTDDYLEFYADDDDD